MKSTISLFLVVMFFITDCYAESTSPNKNIYAVIPAPVSLKKLPGHFIFNKNSRIILSSINTENRLAADLLALLVKNPSDLVIPVTRGTRPARNSVFMSIDTTVRNNEGYLLTVDPRMIVIKARTAAGLFYAVQTIRQLLPPEIERDSVISDLVLQVPSCEIADEPRFPYRGMHLDVGCHMYSMDYIKRYIDMIALHKMNTFHWHLTEDEGWRIEIKKYPELTKIGAFRKETIIGHVDKKPYVYDGKPYGGFYTQEEVKELVAYAKSKFITIIPEIEMPGHCLAALATYPELSCTGGPFEVATYWGVKSDVYCAGKEETFKFLEDVLSEVIELFPSKYIHIGGDECRKDRWKKCPLCQQRIKQEGLKDENELQSYFIKRIEKFLETKGRKIIGWDEILEGGLAPGATVMPWHSVAQGIDAAKQGHDVIMSPRQFTYLNYYQCEPDGQPLAYGGYLPLEVVYSFDPKFVELNPEEQKHIIGLEGCVWTEYLNTPQYMEYMVYPRMFAISEVSWTPVSEKDFDDFLARFNVQKKRYDKIGINYFKGEYRDTRQAKKLKAGS